VIDENSTLDFKSFRCKAKGKLEMIEGRLLMNEILLNPKVIIYDEMHRSKATRILKKGENACLIAHSMKAKIAMEIHVEVQNLLIEN